MRRKRQRDVNTHRQIHRYTNTNTQIHKYREIERDVKKIYREKYREHTETEIDRHRKEKTSKHEEKKWVICFEN